MNFVGVRFVIYEPVTLKEYTPYSWRSIDCLRSETTAKFVPSWSLLAFHRGSLDDAVRGTSKETQRSWRFDQKRDECPVCKWSGFTTFLRRGVLCFILPSNEGMFLYEIFHRYGVTINFVFRSFSIWLKIVWLLGTKINHKFEINRSTILFSNVTFFLTFWPPLDFALVSFPVPFW